MKAATDALPDFKQFAEHPKNYPWYVGALRLAGKIRNSPKPLTLKFFMNYEWWNFSSWNYEGEVDENGEACGYGVATATDSSDKHKTT